jgi:hypothetical protein
LPILRTGHIYSVFIFTILLSVSKQTILCLRQRGHSISPLPSK